MEHGQRRDGDPLAGRERRAIIVVGSANMDMVVSCGRFPQPGETLFGSDFGMYPGGKGANQAVACARLGGEVHFLGKMGDDVFRDTLTASLQRDGVHLGALRIDPGIPTGVALITVDRAGENEIIVVPGSNMRLMPDDLDAEQGLFAEAAIVLVQLEIPLETVEKAAALAASHGARFILNPAPARALPSSLLQYVDFLTPNETEASMLSGIQVTDAVTAEQAARHLLAQGVGCVIVTLGEAGAVLVTGDESRHFSVEAVQPVDTTAAGDAFNGALALALAQGQPLDQAIPFANRAAAFSVTRRGAQPSMPTRDDLSRFQTAGRTRQPAPASPDA